MSIDFLFTLKKRNRRQALVIVDEQYDLIHLALSKSLLRILNLQINETLLPLYGGEKMSQDHFEQFTNEELKEKHKFYQSVLEKNENDERTGNLDKNLMLVLHSRKVIIESGIKAKPVDKPQPKDLTVLEKAIEPFPIEDIETVLNKRKALLNS